MHIMPKKEIMPIMPNFSQIFAKKDGLMPKFDFGQPKQMLRKCLNFPDFEA